MDNVIVTGGSGFLGRHLIWHLCNEQHRVYALVRQESGLARLPKHPNLIPVIGTLETLKDVENQFPEVISAFFHFAWQGVNRAELDDEETQNRNIENSLLALQTALHLHSGCFIFAGSRSEYGVPTDGFQENAVCDPIVAYGRAKLAFGKAAAEICRSSDMQYIHGRIFSVYGRGDHPWSLVSTSIRKMQQNEPLELSACTQLWNYMDVRDMADLMLTFYRQRNRIPEGDNGIFNVATRDIRPLRMYVEEMAQVLESSSPLLFGAYHPAAESEVSLVPDMTKVERIFGWKQKIPFSNGIRSILASGEVQDE